MGNLTLQRFCKYKYADNILITMKHVVDILLLFSRFFWIHAFTTTRTQLNHFFANGIRLIQFWKIKFKCVHFLPGNPSSKQPLKRQLNLQYVSIPSFNLLFSLLYSLSLSLSLSQLKFPVAVFWERDEWQKKSPRGDIEMKRRSFSDTWDFRESAAL
jgi:hypothetical protein